MTIERGKLPRIVDERIKSALKGGRTEELSALRLVKAELSTARVELKLADVSEISDDDVIGILRSMVKKRKKAIELFEQGGRTDLAEREVREIEVIETLLPQALSEDELRDLVAAVIAEAGASGMRDMGKVMAALRGRPGVDPGAASRLVKEALSS